MNIALKVLGFAWQNRGALMRAYHTKVKHRVMLDELLDLAEEHPDHPQNKNKEQTSRYSYGSNKTTFSTNP